MPPAEATLIRLHADYAAGAYQFAWSVTKDESLAQDVVQELFLKIARNAGPVTTADSERAVIFTMVRNLALDALRRRAARDKALDRWAAEMPPPDWFEPVTESDDEDTRLRLTAALAALPEDQRTVIHLHVWEEMSFREIGELLAAPTQTIASRYRYGLEKLRRETSSLQEPFPVPPPPATGPAPGSPFADLMCYE